MLCRTIGCASHIGHAARGRIRQGWGFCYTGDSLPSSRPHPEYLADCQSDTASRWIELMYTMAEDGNEARVGAEVQALPDL